MDPQTFIVDCHICKAKVAAIEKGSVSQAYQDEESYYPEGEKVMIGFCPRCKNILVGKADQIGFEGINDDQDRWSNVIRVYPNPRKTFQSRRIPRSAKESLSDADLSLQANANIAACVMFGRALEAVCKDALGTTKITLAKGVDMLKEKGIIDSRLYDWSQQLRAFRNLAAHADTDVSSISRRDAEDLQSFVYAIIEYVYDLTDRYNEFKARLEKKDADEKDLVS
jgi:hypothetical protein